MPLASRCRRDGYVCGARLVMGSVPIVLALVFVVYILVPHVRADGCLTGRGGSIVLAGCWLLFDFGLAPEVCRKAPSRHDSLRAAGSSILLDRVHG